MADLMSRQQQLQQRQALAQQLMQAQYVPNSGKLGVLGAIASQLAGNMQQRSNNQSLTDILRDQFSQQLSQAKAARQQQLADEKRKWAEEIQGSILKDRGRAQADQDYAKPTYVTGVGFVDGKGNLTVDPRIASTLQSTAAAEANAAAAAAARYREAPGAGALAELNAKIALAKANGATPSDIARMLTGHDSSNQIVPGVGVVDKDTGQVKPMVGADGKPITQPLTVAQQETAGKGVAGKQVLSILDDIQKKLKNGTAWTGPIDQYIPGEGQQSFQAAIDQLVNPLQTLTRVPGQGSQSDAELKQLMAGFPSLGSREDVNQEKIARLRQYVTNLVSQGNPTLGQQTPQQQTPGQLSDADLLKKYGGL